NGDGKLDAVVPNSGSNTVSVLIGDGAGGFDTAATKIFSVGSSPLTVGVADLDFDGRLDLVVVNQSSNNLTVLYGTCGSCPTITVSPDTLPNKGVGGIFDPVTASGGVAPYTFAVTSGALPTGMSLTSAGFFSGRP